MKKGIFILTMLSLIACESGSEDSKNADAVTKIDDLPKGEWNGEYIEIKDTLAEEKKPKKKSKGADYFNMGTVKVFVDTMEFSIDLFDQKKNHLTINRNSLMMRIKSAQRDFISITIKKPDILKDPIRTYDIDADGSKPTSSAIDFSRLSVNEPIMLTMVSGTTTLEEFSSGLGKVVLNATGKFKDADGELHDGRIEVNMRFESVVSTFNPKENA